MSTFVALGSNLGDRAGNLRRALAELGFAGLPVRQASSVWETGPVDCDLPDLFLNAVVRVEDPADPLAALRRLLAIESRMGRVRGGRNAPRIVDLDLLMSGGHRAVSRELTLPHPRMWERRFVLAPLAELDPGLTHPDSGEPIGAVADRLAAAEPHVHRVGPLALPERAPL